jgi:hypothetical protein
MSNAEDLKQQFAIAPEMLERLVSKPRAARKSQHFVRVPMAWVSRLSGTSGHTYQVALQLLYLNWRDRGKPIKLGNRMLGFDGVSRFTKWRALRDLERRGLIEMEIKPRCSPNNLLHFCT